MRKLFFGACGYTPVFLVASSHFTYEPNVQYSGAKILFLKKRNSKVNHVFFRAGLLSTRIGALVPEDIIY